MIAKVTTIAPMGFDGAIIEVEADAKAGLPFISIVGMGNKAITEAKERVRSAITSSLLSMPARKLVINLAPAELPKDGSSFDLAIALSILVVSGQLKQHEVNNAVFIGELALDGSVRPVRSVITAVETAHQAGYSAIFVPVSNTAQALLVPNAPIIGVESLQELYLHLKGQRILVPPLAPPSPPYMPPNELLFHQIKDQALAQRAAVIACAGHHNLLLNGPPGAGKTLLARAMQELLPPPHPDEQLVITKIHSAAGLISDKPPDQRPFRSPHHTMSPTALTGGGHRLQPGEMSLAHLGILFLDELPEFSRAHLEALRQPLEDRSITIARTHGQSTFPADFMLVATMNPCPCGYYEDPTKECRCSTQQILAYQQRISGPLLDRIDLRLTMQRPKPESIFDSKTLIKNQHLTLLNSIITARNMQNERYKRNNIYNGNVVLPRLLATADVEQAAQTLLTAAQQKLSLSLRGVGKVLRVARTIADLDQQPSVTKKHIAEALQFR